MNLKEIMHILNARLHYGEDKLDVSINSVSAGDLMSDLLACPQSNGLLLTGLLNIQVIRTAEMLDLAAVIFINNKQPTAEMIELAGINKLPVLTTRNSLFTSCGLLFEAGFKSDL